MGRRSSTPPPSIRDAERHTYTTTATQTEQTQDGMPAAVAAVEGEDDMLCTERGVEEMVTMMEEDLGDHTCPALRLVLEDEGTVCARIFRWALARLVGWDGKGGRKGLATEIKSRVPVLAVDMDAEVFSDDTFQCYPHRHCTVLLVLMRMVEAELAVAKGGAAPEAKNRRLTLERRNGGASGKKKRRVSFSTFDLSTIDTPDLTKRGSTSPMDKVLSSLLLVLKAAETVRNSLIPSNGEPLPTADSRGKENIPSHDGAHDDNAPLSATGSKPQQAHAPRTVIEKLVKLLADLQVYGMPSIGGDDGHTDGTRRGFVSALLGRSVNWTEISNAAGLYAHELRVLLLEKDPIPSTCHTPGPQTSRLLGRYHEVLSSLLRHELKRLLNMCTCGGEEAGGVFAGQPGAAAYGQSADAMHRCCSCLVIVAETGNLQYNSDDPAALLHFALERIHAHKGAWEALVNAAMESSSALTSQQLQLSQGPRGETDVVCHTEAKEAHGDEEDGGCRPPRAKAQFSFRRKSWHECRADSDEEEEPRWCAVAREWGRDALCYLGAVSFLLRVMHEPVVENAVTAGRWARVEYLAKMLSSNGGPKVRVMPGDEGLGALWDVELLIESLEEDLKTAEEIRETLQATILEGMAEGLGPGHYSGGARMPSHIRRKRKRRAKSLEGPLTEILVWARFDEVPPALCFPCLTPGCVYAEPSMVAAYQEDMCMMMMMHQQQQQQAGGQASGGVGAVVGGAGEGSES